MAKEGVIDLGNFEQKFKAPFITDFPAIANGDRVIFMYDYVNYNIDVISPVRSMSRQEQELFNYKTKKAFYEKTFKNKVSTFIGTVQACGESSVADHQFGYKHIIKPKQRILLDGAREYGTVTINGVEFLHCRHDAIVAVLNEEPPKESTFEEFYNLEKELFFTSELIVKPAGTKLILPENANA